MADRFAGKNILITGGSSGIGLGTARQIAAEGGTVVLVGRSEDKLDRATRELGAAEDRVHAISADVSDLDALDRMIGEVRERVGQLDGMFVNAGFGKFLSTEDSDEDAFDAVFSVNAKGAFFTTKKALPLLKRPAAVVITASWTSHRGLPSGTLYAATKGAVNTMVKTLMSEHGGDGLRFNSVSPGIIDTAGIADMGEDERAFWRGQIPMGRMGTPEDVGKVVAFLLSDEAAYVAGEDVLIDGGLSRTLAMS